MEILAFSASEDHVSARYRIKQFEPFLGHAGLNLKIEPFADQVWQRIGQLTRPKPNQVVVVQRKLLPIAQLLMLRATSKFLIYDFDDAIFIRDSYYRGIPVSATRLLRFWATVSMADLVIAGNRFLADDVRRFTRRTPIEVIPTCVDSRLYEPACHAERLPARMVWIGSKSTFSVLNQSRDILEAIGQAVPNAVLRVICDRFPSYQHLRVERSPWSAQSEGPALQAADIGFSWVPNDHWSRGKCGLKVLQYMAAGLPVLASPVGVHRDFLAGGNGMLPTQLSEWVTFTRDLVNDAKLRAQIGTQARQWMMNHLDVSHWGPIFADQMKIAAQTI